jgi:hypothetical protein
MNRDHKHDPKAAGAADHDQAPPAQQDPRAAKWHAMMKAATAWNAAHPDLVAEFNKLTDGKYAGDKAGVSFRALRQWQADHGLPADGKVGKKTIDVAKKEKQPAGEKSDVTFTDAEAGADASSAGGAEEAVAGGVADNEEKRDKGEGEDGSTLVQDGAEKIGNDIAGEGHGVGMGVASRMALVPHVVALLREHKFKEAVKFLADSVGAEDRVEIIKFVVEKVRGELSEHALELFEKAARIGLVYDVLKLGWEWTYGGIKAVQEAHEHGDRDSRIGIYAWAWSDCVLKGSHQNPGAVTEEQRKAMELGIQDGLSTRDRSPELSFLLIAEYGSESNARHALEDALYKRAGISVKTHVGR